MEAIEFSNPLEIYVSVSELLIKAALLIPISHYLLGLLLIFLIFLYNFLEIHLLQDLLTGFRGKEVFLTFNSCSEIYGGVVSKCRILHGRYFPTIWLSSPHLQIAFLNFFGRPPLFDYRRQLFHAPDGGTIALDWLMSSDVLGGTSSMNKSISKDDTTPIVVVIPGLTSDSDSTYIKHIAFKIAKSGWNVVVSNHRGLGGVSITSDCFYNAGWTDDIRKVVEYLHQEYPEAPLFAIGTSIGANVLVKYLGEDGDNTYFAGAAAICSPWDLLIGDRFITRRLPQRIYGRFLTIGLQGYAQLCFFLIGHQIVTNLCSMNNIVNDLSTFYEWLLLGSRQIWPTWANLGSPQSIFCASQPINIFTMTSFLKHQSLFSRLADWEGISKSRTVRDFDNYATRLVGKFETVDAYYRHCSSAPFVANVSIPLLCISALDDPVCTREAIPWDECRVNKNIVLATTKHGGHLAYFEGIGADRLWWVGAVDEYLKVLYCSPYMHKRKKTQNPPQHSLLESSIDQGPYVSITEDGMVSAMGNERMASHIIEEVPDEEKVHEIKSENTNSDTEKKDNKDEAKTDSLDDISPSDRDSKLLHDLSAPVKRCINQLSRQSTTSIWLLAYVAILMTWPVLGSALRVVFKRKFSNFFPASWLKR